MKPNVLFIVIDQLRADCIQGALADFVPLPNIDRLRGSATTFLNHYSATAPCGPSRASLLTGLRPATHGVWHNRDPLRPGITNLALEARKLGYEPLLFGYTDSQPHEEGRHPQDPDLAIYENIMPGFREIVEMRLEYGFEWPGYLKSQGYAIEIPLKRQQIYKPKDGVLGNPAIYAARDSDTAYLTSETIKHLDIRRGAAPWFAHLTYIRPHPPLVAPDPYHALINPKDLPAPIARSQAPAHKFIDSWFSEPGNFDLYHGYDGQAQAMSAETKALLRATYLGLLAEVDHHLGRLFAWLDETGEAANTLLILTADHGEMLGDYGMWGKATVFPQAFHVPLIIRLPGQTEAICQSAFTGSIDVMPAILDCLGGQKPASCEGRSLKTLLKTKASEPSDNFESRSHIKLGGSAKLNRFDKAGFGEIIEIVHNSRGHRVRFPDDSGTLELPATHIGATPMMTG